MICADKFISDRKTNISPEIEEILNDYDWMNNQYNILLRSVMSIAKSLNISTYYVTKHLKNFGFRIRPHSEQCKLDTTKNLMSKNHMDFSGNNNPRYGKHLTDETKNKISIANSNPSIETRSKMSLSHMGEKSSMFGKKGNRHPNFGKHWDEETRKKMSDSHKGKGTGKDNPMYGKTGDQNPFFGKHHTEEVKKHLSLIPRPSGKDSYRYGKPPAVGAGRGKGAYFVKADGNKIWLRSMYEIFFAIGLEKNNILWEYEKRIDLEDCFWHPDFYLSEHNMYIEVKGYLNDYSKHKMVEFYNQFPDTKLIVMQYKDIIDFLDNDKPIHEVGMSLEEYLKTNNAI